MPLMLAPVVSTTFTLLGCLLNLSATGCRCWPRLSLAHRGWGQTPMNARKEDRGRVDGGGLLSQFTAGIRPPPQEDFLERLWRIALPGGPQACIFIRFGAPGGAIFRGRSNILLGGGGRIRRGGLRPSRTPQNSVPDRGRRPPQEGHRGAGAPRDRNRR